MLSGILLINKESGPTSHDVVAALRKISGQRRIGHTGTLDPMAEGLLVVCLGAACRIIRFTDETKEYRAVMQLGIRTDTLDKTGRVIEESPCPRVTKKDIESVIARFKGTISQTPPMYSAVRHKGKKLYELARQGKTVKRTPRKVRIDDIRIEKIDLPFIGIKVTCSKGTYIRSLAADIGEALGGGAVLDRLTRTRVGPFSLNEAVRIPEISSREVILRLLRSVDAGLEHLSSVQLDSGDLKKFKNGMTVKIPEAIPEPADNRYIRLYDSGSSFIGIGERKDRQTLKPCVVLAPLEMR